MKQNNFKRWSSYLILEIRKGIHLIPFFFITMAVTAAAVILAAVIFRTRAVPADVTAITSSQ